MGSQIFPVFLGRYEGVWSNLAAHGPLLMIVVRQPFLADEVQTFKALYTIHKVLQEGHPIAVREAQANTGWLETLSRGIGGEGMKGIAK